MECMEKRDELTIEAIKFAVGGLSARGISPKETLVESIDYLLNQFEIYRKTEYLEQALVVIQAFLQLGFPYEIIVKKMAMITQELSLENYQVSDLIKISAKKIKVSKLQIRSMIGRWNPKGQSMSINEVVDDIIKKIKEHEKGSHLYYNGIHKDRKYGNVYELLIDEKECIFHDIKRNKYYFIEE